MAEDHQIRGYRLYRATLKLSSDQWEAFLEGKEDSDSEAVKVARKALLAHAAATEIPGGGTALVADRRRMDRVGSVVNGWKLEMRLGIGGFGRVFLGSKTGEAGPEFAAVKFLDIAPDQVGRFRRERQLLANLDHPGIPRFLDAGNDEGVPFVIMEYVSGLPITLHCNRQKLTISKRLSVFVKLCQIMEYAHQRVIHRDLKPDNILATESGQVYVLDLGLARSLDPEDGGQILTKAPLFTKAYASPEQVLMESPGWATDVYALGVILYEMVTGRRPFSDAALSGDWKEVICHQAPLRPSEAVKIGVTVEPGTPGSAPPETGGLPGQLASSLSRVLTGDLDAVILKALNKNPADRYQTARAFREDIERFMAGFSVTARKSGLMSRAWKWSTKNQRTAALFVVSLLILIVVLHFSGMRLIEYNARYTDELNAVKRVGFLLAAGFPRIEKSLDSDGAVLSDRLTALQIHSELLSRMATLPDSALLRLDQSLMESSIECGSQFLAVGDPVKGLAVTETAVKRAEFRYRTEAEFPVWKRHYTNLLHERIKMNAMLDRASESAADSERLAEIEKIGH